MSLFTNIPLDLAIDSIKRRWHYIGKETTFLLNKFIIAISFILSSTYFTFNNIIYKQTFGVPMGSLLSLIIADLVLQDLENKALNKICVKLPFYYRYVDDIVLAAPAHTINNIITIFNSFHNRLKFTVEWEENRSINFLDLRICISNLIIF